eukprot:7380348-Prymnesium_polylepis.2
MPQTDLPFTAHFAHRFEAAAWHGGTAADDCSDSGRNPLRAHSLGARGSTRRTGRPGSSRPHGRAPTPWLPRLLARRLSEQRESECSHKLLVLPTAPSTHHVRARVPHPHRIASQLILHACCCACCCGPTAPLALGRVSSLPPPLLAQCRPQGAPAEGVGERVLDLRLPHLAHSSSA